MTEQTDEQKIDVANEAEKLEQKYGELASIYAENRAEAASLRGADQDAELWHEVEDEVEDNES